MEKIPKFNKRSAFYKAVGPGKLIYVGHTFIPDNRVVRKFRIFNSNSDEIDAK